MSDRKILTMIVGLLAPTMALAQNKVDFSHDVLPILKARCASCHTNGTYKGGLSIDTREALLKSKAVVVGKSASSELIKRVSSTDTAERMPPKGNPLAAKEKAILAAWIDSGLSWEQGFSFKPAAYVAPLKPRQVNLPTARGNRNHPIDRIIDAYLAGRKLPEPKPLDDSAFIRRVYLDLIGLPPAAKELEAFLADTSPDKRTATVSRLLAENRLEAGCMASPAVVGDDLVVRTKTHLYRIGDAQAAVPGSR